MTKKVKIPKRIGDVKIPKKVRKKARKALDSAGSPTAREFAAAALGMARARAEAWRDEARVRAEAWRDEARVRAEALRGEARARAEDWREEVKAARAEGRPERMCDGARVHIDGGRVKEAFRTAARDALRRFVEGFEEGLRNAAEAEPDRAEAERGPSRPPRPPRPPRAARTPRTPRRPRGPTPPEPDSA